MSTATEVLERHGNDAAAAAVEIVRRFAPGSELGNAALLWCERYGGGIHTFEKYDRRGPARAAHALLHAALRDHIPLGDWVRRAKDARRDEFATGLLSAILALWRVRDAVGEYPNVLRAWAAAADSGEASAVAYVLRDFPDLAPAVLGPPRYVPPDPGSCGGCAEHKRDDATTCVSHLYWVAMRREDELEPHAFESEILEAVPPSAFAADKLVRHAMALWLRSGVPAPPSLWPAAEEALGTEAWLGGVALLLRGDVHHQALALDVLERGVRFNQHPGAILDWLRFEGGGGLSFTGVFAGRGWGRDVRPGRLRPLARAYLERGTWPAAWSAALRPERERVAPDARKIADVDREDSPEERAHEAEREVLAEAFFSYAIDERADVGQRRRAIDALEELAPGGNGSWAKGLAKVKGPDDLMARAREVRRLLSKKHRRPDAELAIADALRTFLGHEPVR